MEQLDKIEMPELPSFDKEALKGLLNKNIAVSGFPK